MQPSSILISGGLGFIGLKLAQALSPTHQVTLIDNLSSAQVQKAPQGTRLLVGEVKDQLSHLNPADFDLFYHLGEYSRVEQSLTDFSLCMNANFGPLARVLEFCREGEVKLVYSGSSTKFSTGTVGKNLSPYTWSKAANTELVTQFAHWYKLHYAICYFYNVYGPGEIASGHYSTLIGKFVEAKRAGQRVQVTAPGTQRRNFTHIEDTVRALIAIGEAGTGDGHCIANPEAFSVLDVAERLGLEYDMGPPNPANRMAAGYDLTKMEALGWSAQLFLGDYLDSV